jgi:ABC-2 type transport system permease protein
MKKFLAVVKREYMQRVRAKMFIVSTILLPLVMSLFGIVPAIILSIKTPPMRVAVVDQNRQDVWTTATISFKRSDGGRHHR